MEVKLKERLFRNHTLPVAGDGAKAYKRITGMTSGNIAGISSKPVTYERSGEYLVHLAEIEIKRSLALAEVHRLSLR